MASSSFTDREQRRQARLTAALNDPVFGWKVAQCFADQRRLVPPSIRIPAIRRANYHLCGQYDQAVAEAEALTHPSQHLRRVMLKGFLFARDIDPAGIAGYLSVNEETIGLYSDLFFNVRDRLEDRWYISGIVYPETRLGGILEVEKECEISELIFIRVGHEQGWKAVAKLAGLMTLAEDRDADKTLDELEKQVAGFGTMLAGIGHLHKEKSPGINHAMTLLRARKQRPVQGDKMPMDRVEQMSMRMPLIETFLETTKPDVERRIALQLRPPPGKAGHEVASEPGQQ